ncbi:sigma-54 dependent transcriptional regulator [Oryzomicrobium sp.]|uniref:sigma-54-dependent transcriptional regulator n=1 Tax=Oryzomicrobium sp. TaxID=1911578 RepID=UPI0025FC1E30|nr:sigma-54 dependent transcriptional regulator [Oryzomicrobium sp.]MCE1244999.1 sigma-54 dependent transcriptional regulator [Oryzomicrobium sp.]
MPPHPHAGIERRAWDGVARVLVVDDEPDIRELLDLTLARMGLLCDCAGTVGEARDLLARHAYQLCLTDMRLPDGEGLDVVRHVAEQHSQTPVAVITAYGSTENAVAALKAGAFDYLAKPVALDQLRTLVKSALDVPGEKAGAPASGGLVGSSPVMQQVKDTIAKLARNLAPVYISGESGTGKERAARLIHGQGPRAAGAFVAVNCGAIPENLMESEFFGYRKGAFTGADSERDGFFQAAHGGTLFLDEVADLPLAMQVKLLRAIQEKRVRKVGATQEEAVDVRIISATHRDLRACVEAGTFRQDLYYRLNVIELRLPPLRERREDIPALVETVLARLVETAGAGAAMPRLDDGAQAALRAYSFPGNVRELENILERAHALCEGDAIGEADLQLEPRDSEGSGVEAVMGRCEESLDDYLNRIERQAILEALEQTHNNRTAAARVLGITFRSLRYRLERLGIE